ncbi:DUF927 domain-containing protein [Methylobacterium sp. WSM2598]|uniref:DUF927 domain-containing protein n=1 Tax=Methylobacterium sp. WSM2598 TaxID=398261 RepID=UPI00035FDF0D|nr:DUF927 domain-containing protein [Methylobacterium sp. WSM2598]
MINLYSLARALGGEVRNGQVLAPGPGHSAADRSLSVRISEDGQDIVVHSFAGDDWISCRDYVSERAGLPRWKPSSRGSTALNTRRASRVRRRSPRPDPSPKEATEMERAARIDSAILPHALDLDTNTTTGDPVSEIVMPVPDGAPVPNFLHPSYGPSSGNWAYRDAEGRLLGYVLRFDPPGQRKQFFPLTLWRENTALRWRWKSWPKPRPLYGLDLLAAKPNSSVVAVEGEKAADAARMVFEHSVVITSSGGAMGARAADWRPLAGRSVLIWPDCDEPGDRYASEVMAELDAIGAGTITLVGARALATRDPAGGTREIPEGWDAADGLDEGWEPQRLREAVLSYVGQVEPPPAYISFDNFHMNSDGLTVEIPKGRGENRTTEEIWCSGPFEVIGRARDPQGHGWARWLRWRDPDGRCHEYAVSDAALHAEPGALAAELAIRGLTVARNGRQHLADYLNRVTVDARVTTVSCTGWHTVADQNVFVLPEQVIGQPARETVVLVGGAAAPYSSRGTLDDWRQGVGRLSAGHVRLVLAISTALAGPLVHLVGSEGGGVNLYGQSSKGKTTALRAAASVWGRGSADPGFIRSWRATANAQESTAAIVTDTCLCLDEIGVAEGRDAAAAVYQLASGVGKGRSARDGSIRSPMTWRVLTLSTGEIPMAAKISEDRQRRAYAGQAVRLLDIPADAGQGFGVFDHAGEEGDPARLADTIKEAALRAYGTAGPAFVRALFGEGHEKIARAVRGVVDQFVADQLPPDADGQVRRGASRLGLIAAAGELASMFGIVPWEKGEAAAAAAKALADWIATRGGSEPAEVREAIAQVRRFFEAHGESRFEPMDDKEAKPVPNRAGWRRETSDGKRVWLVLPEAWKADVCAGLDPVATARLLADRGMLKRDPQGKLQRSERTPYKASQRVYVITADMFEGGDDGR